ncbi:MAG: peptidoglycan-binding protein [Clostridia bacterium]|nr:peptidoglycan-binding protein [Clostridia bacterium]
MKNRITKRFAMMAILCVLIVSLAAPALAASYSKVYGRTQERIRVRESASTSATVIDNIIKGACVYVTDSRTSGSTVFVKVNYRNSSGNIDSGWVCQKDGSTTYVKILSAEQAQKSFSVKSGNLPSAKVGTFTAAQRETAEKTASVGTSANTIKSVQKMLKDLGYYSGEITGNVGTKTEAAIKKFQGEYHLTKDGVAGPMTVSKLESVYNSKGGTVSTSASGSALKLGSTGSKVRDLQLDLTTLGYYWADITGSFGAKTQAAVKTFQQRNNLTADGVAGAKTLNAIASAVARKGGSSSGSSYSSGTTLKLNSQGSAVTQLQTDLKQLGYYYADITGNFGSKTEAAVKSFQSAKGLTSDGVAGSKTLSAIATAVKNVGGSVSVSGSGLKLGSTGDKVRDLQADLTALGYYYGDITGHYGSLTQTAVKKFQKAKGITQDGVAGTTTINAIASALKSTGVSSNTSSSGSSLREGDSGSAVLEMQTLLKQLGYYYGELTGSFGSLTKKAVRSFQDAQNLTVDGIAGTNTLNKLYALAGKTNSSSSASASGTTVKESESYGRINKANVNLRSSYSTSSAAKASLKEGKLLRITKVYNVAGVKWYYVTVETGNITHKGYVRGDMVTLISASEYANGGGLDLDLGDGEILGMIRVTGSSVNLREEPDSDSDKVGTASKGEVFYYVDTEDGWFQTKAGYWIKKDYVEVMSDAEVDDYVNSDSYDGGTYRNGDTGSMILWLQEALDDLGYYDGSKTGHFGNLTEEAVKDFQKDHNLTADGVAGPKTINAIIAAVSNDFAGGSQNSAYKDKIYNINWFANKSKIISGTGTYKLTDISTGRTFSIKIQSAGNHADVEPLTKTDTEVLCSLYGVANATQLDTMNKWQRRAVVMTNGNGEQFVGSIYAIPHGLNTVSGNNFDGQFCVHFLGSTIHAGDGGSVNESDNHQAKIKAGVSALKAAGHNVLETYP